MSNQLWFRLFSNTMLAMRRQMNDYLTILKIQRKSLSHFHYYFGTYYYK